LHPKKVDKIQELQVKNITKVLTRPPKILV